MNDSLNIASPLLGRNRYDLFDFLQGIYRGNIFPWLFIGFIVVWIVFNVTYKKWTGKSFVKSRKERREARRRRKIVVWEFTRKR